MFRRLSCFAIILIVLILSDATAPAESVWHVGRMANGVGIHIFSTNSNRVAFAFRFKTGAVNDPEGREGLSHLLEHLSYSCSPEISQLDLDRFVSLHAGIVNATTNWFETTYYWELPVSEWKVALNFERQRLVNFSVTEKALALEKRIVARELSDGSSCSNANSVSTVLSKYLDVKQFRSIGGTLESLAAITLDDVKKYHQQFYTPDNLDIFVTGGITPPDINAEITSGFSTIEKSSATEEAVRIMRTSGAPSLFVDESNSAGVFVTVFDKTRAEAAKCVASALFAISGSPVVRKSLVEDRFLASLSVKSVRLGDVTAILVMFEPSSGQSVSDCWDRMTTGARSFVKSKEFGVAFSAARSKALAVHLRNLESPMAQLRDICGCASVDEHLEKRNFLSELSADDIAKRFISNYDIREIVLGHIANGDSDILLNRKKRSAMQREAKHSNGDVVTYRFPDGPFINIQQTDNSDISDILVKFPFAFQLNHPEDILSSRTFFHSTRFDEPTTYRFEKLGWFWDIEPDSWRFWGLSSNCDFVAALVCDILSEFAFNAAEYQLQHDLFFATTNLKEQLLNDMRTKIAAERKDKDALSFGDKVVGAFGSRRFLISVDAPRITGNLKMAFTRCFGTPTENSPVEFPAMHEGSFDILTSSISKTDGNRCAVGMYLIGPSYDSDDYPLFFVLAQMLGTGGGLSGVIPEAVRNKDGLAYDVSVSLDWVGNTPVILAVALTAENDSENAIKAMVTSLSSILNGDFTDTSGRDAISQAIAVLSKSIQSDLVSITLTAGRSGYTSLLKTYERTISRLRTYNVENLRKYAGELSSRADIISLGN